MIIRNHACLNNSRLFLLLHRKLEYVYEEVGEIGFDYLFLPHHKADMFHSSSSIHGDGRSVVLLKNYKLRDHAFGIIVDSLLF